mmetsp:Transcript_25036/g.77368  ORF Transcript_25036/g.77368 Transcript_25036/m.77368 type:complete len:331 (-) Transcript_25036:964-1956(-)
MAPDVSGCTATVPPTSAVSTRCGAAASCTWTKPTGSTSRAHRFVSGSVLGHTTRFGSPTERCVRQRSGASPEPIWNCCCSGPSPKNFLMTVIRSDRCRCRRLSSLRRRRVSSSTKVDAREVTVLGRSDSSFAAGARGDLLRRLGEPSAVAASSPASLGGGASELLRAVPAASSVSAAVGLSSGFAPLPSASAAGDSLSPTFASGSLAAGGSSSWRSSATALPVGGSSAWLASAASPDCGSLLFAPSSAAVGAASSCEGAAEFARLERGVGERGGSGLSTPFRFSVASSPDGVALRRPSDAAASLASVESACPASCDADGAASCVPDAPGS